MNVNFSKSGVGVSYGIGGVRFGVNSKGKAYRSFNIPGSGLTWFDYYSTKSNVASNTNKFRALNINNDFKNISSNKPKPEIDYIKYSKDELTYVESNKQGQTIIYIIGFSFLLISYFNIIWGLILFSLLFIYLVLFNKKKQSLRDTLFQESEDYRSLGNTKMTLSKLLSIYSGIPDDFEVLYKIGGYYFVSKEYTKAIRYLKEALVLKPNDYHTNMLLGVCNNSINTKDSHAQSLIYYRKVLEIAPYNDDIRMCVAGSLYKLNEYASSIAYLRSIRDEKDNHLAIITNIATCYIKMEQYELALNELNKAPLRKKISSNELKEIHYLIGILNCDYLGNKEKGIEHFKKVRSVDRDYKDLLKRLKHQGI